MPKIGPQSALRPRPLLGSAGFWRPCPPRKGPSHRIADLHAFALTVVGVYEDAGVSGAKGRDKRPAFDKLCRDAARRKFDVVMAWSVDRLGRSLQDLVGFLNDLP